MFTTELAEIVLIVEDVERSAHFYRRVVGLVPENEPDDAWFWAGAPGHAQRVALHNGTLLFEEESPLPEGERWDGSTTPSTFPAKNSKGRGITSVRRAIASTDPPTWTG